MTTNKQMVPELRFKGFTDAWEQRKVSELADRYDNHRVPITASERVAGRTPYYGANGIQDHVEGFTHDGEFILVAEDGANDLQNYPVQYVDGKVWVNNHAHVLQAKEETADNKFLMNALKHTNIEPYLVGGGRAKLNADVMMKIDFKVPTLPEQIQIGKFFDNLDHLITLHQRKLELLKRLKQGYLQKLFPQNGENVPELRFKGYSDAWEKRKLIDQLSLLKDGTHGTHKDGNFAFLLSAKNVIQDSIVFDDSDRKISEDDFNDIYANYHIKKNDVLLTIVGTIGRVALFPRLTVPVAFQRSVAILRTKPTLFPYFLALELQTPTIQSKIKARANMSAQAGIYLGDLKKVVISIPKSEEQIEIAMSLNRLTNLIAATQHKENLLKKIKQACLQNMFC
ncbi:restriction endonuclease subunit S [Lacticaseibacillus rhamnosus]|uniref:restriction endonuclease subunit S n=1 Tax=Lacticaseibacillus rhamnosus TaxID=47715 RepID=UPI0007DF7364|nr:restriction endonuclease subunit S [Lacticaseibacillus rhamnosus]OAU16772.1 restriction endonuclease subunit S [Lacticaseibacillus rhamnosus]